MATQAAATRIMAHHNQYLTNDITYKFAGMSLVALTVRSIHSTAPPYLLLPSKLALSPNAISQYD